MRHLRWICVPVLFVVACGGGQKKKAEPPPPPPPVEKPKPPPPPPPVCVTPGAQQSLIGMVEADDSAVKFCVSDGDSNKCYSVDLGKKKYAELDTPPTGQSPVLDPDPAKIETTNTTVKVCVGEDCKTLKPKMPKGNQNPIDAVVNATGTIAAVSMGNAEKGKGTVDVWDVVKGKKISTIKYVKGDYKCGETRVLGNTVFVSASVCAGPAARGWLFNTKGKKVADVGGKEFGTYQSAPVQVADNTWAFLDENGATIALQDVATGKVEKTIDIGGMWAGDAAAAGGDADAGAPPAMGNPGESAIARGGEGKLVVVTGGPKPGSIGVVDVAGGTLADTVSALVCEDKAAAPADGADSGGDDTGSDDSGGDDSGDDSSGGDK